MRLPAALPRSAYGRWAVQVRVLGPFEVMHGDAPLRSTRKGSPRTLDLLKAIIAFGGRDVSIEKIAATLWPDADGDLARGAFDVSVHRLRKLVGSRSFVTVHEGKVALNPGLCWLDVWEFRRQAQAVIDHAGQALIQGTELATAAMAMLDCYRGHFLVNETEHAWLLDMRLTLQRQFERAADMAGVRLQALGMHGAAVALYRGVRDAGRQ
jgi:DNA-binding SARP family transcriptional activator